MGMLVTMKVGVMVIMRVGVPVIMRSCAHQPTSVNFNPNRGNCTCKPTYYTMLAGYDVGELQPLACNQ